MNQKISWRAVTLGYLTDMGTTAIFVLAMSILLLDPGSGTTSPVERFDPKVLEILGLGFGLFFTGLGGFVAARLAPTQRYLHAFLAGSLSVLTTLFQYGFSPADVTGYLYQSGLFLTIPVALWGALVATLFRD